MSRASSTLKTIVSTSDGSRPYGHSRFAGLLCAPNCRSSPGLYTLPRRMEDPDGIWITGRGSGEFRRTSAGWVHGVDVGAWRDLPVPGARDITLEELHGHRVIRAADVAARAWWAPSGALYVRVRDARDFAELAWARTRFDLRDPVHGTVSGFPIEDWERRRAKVIGLWAPELLRADCRGAVATAGLDERAAARDARWATAYRRALVHRGARQFRLSRRQLADATRVSRGRIDQILGEPVSSGSVAARDATSAEELIQRLDRAASAHRDAIVHLSEARAARVEQVAEARKEGVSLAQLAVCLGVTRGRVQQLAAR